MTFATQVDRRWKRWNTCALRSAAMPMALLSRFGTGPGVDLSADIQALKQVIRETPEFLAALDVQNPGVAASARGLLEGRYDDGMPSRLRKKAMMVFRYLSRYCSRAETVGSFNPLAWGTFDDEGETQFRAATVPPRRRVFFEVWAMRALCETTFEDNQYALPLRVHPNAILADKTAKERAIGALCSGINSSHWVANMLVELGVYEMVDAALSSIDAAVRDGWLLRSVVFAQNVESRQAPEAVARDLIARLASGSRRADALTTLDNLEAARARAEAATSSQQFGDALRDIEAAFASFVTRERSESERTVVYEDSVTSHHLTLGKKPLAQMQSVIVGLLRAASWFTARVFELNRIRLTDVFHQVARGRNSVWLPELFESYPVVFNPLRRESTEATHVAQGELSERWRSVFTTACISREEFDVRTSEQFPEQAWLRAFTDTTKHSIDVLLAGESIDEVALGRGHFVLGELHPTYPGFVLPPLVDFHPRREELLNALATNGDETFFLRAPSWRRCPYPPPGVTSLSVGAAESGPLGVRAGEVRVHMKADGNLWAQSPGREVLLQSLLSAVSRRQAFDAFRVEVAGTAGRLQVDNFILRRASWVWEQPFISSLTRSTRQVEALTSWCDANSAPPWLFLRVPGEKPILLYARSLLSIQNALNMVRDYATVRVYEMLPGPNELWMRTQRDPCVSEIRCTFEDSPFHGEA